MQVSSLLVAASLALAACEAVNEGEAEAEGPEFSLGSACLTPGPEPSVMDTAATAERAFSADTSRLQVQYISPDSLRFVLAVDLNCGLKYAFFATLPAPDTLVVAERVIGGSVARCMCRKELTVSMRAESGQSLDKVKVLKSPSGDFLDFH